MNILIITNTPAEFSQAETHTHGLTQKPNITYTTTPFVSKFYHDYFDLVLISKSVAHDARRHILSHLEYGEAREINL